MWAQPPDHGNFSHPAEVLFSCHKLCLMGSVSAWLLHTIINKGYFSLMAVYKYNYFYLFCNPHLCYLCHLSYSSPSHHALCDHLCCF